MVRNTQRVIYQARSLASSRKKKPINSLHRVSYKGDYYYVRISIEGCYIGIV